MKGERLATRGEKLGMPTVFARMGGTMAHPLLVVRCPYCQRVHFHGGVPGPRKAICGQNRHYLVQRGADDG